VIDPALLDVTPFLVPVPGPHPASRASSRRSSRHSRSARPPARETHSPSSDAHSSEL
jgi:hypothetical protein